MRRLIAWTLLGMTGCTTPIELDVPGGYEPRLVVDSRFTPDSVWAVGLQRSVPYADSVSAEAYLVTDAVVSVEGEDGFREELVHVGDGAFRSMSGSRPVSEVQYTLAVDAPGLPSVRAESSVPSVDAALIDLQEEAPANEDEEGAYVIRLNLHDMPGPHRYSVDIDLLTRICYDERELWITSEDPDAGALYNVENVLFTSDLPSMRHSISQVESPSEFFSFAAEPFFSNSYFSDDLFEGKTKEIAIRVTIENPSGLMPHFRILVRSWSDALWRREESAERYGRYVDGGSLFLDRPINLYSNVEDGLGVFGGWSQVALFVDGKGNVWSEEDFNIGLSYVGSCEEDPKNAE